MSTNYMIRDQYRAMANIGTPDLTQAAKLQRIRDLRQGFTDGSPNPQLKKVTYYFNMNYILTFNNSVDYATIETVVRGRRRRRICQPDAVSDPREFSKTSPELKAGQ